MIPSLTVKALIIEHDGLSRPERVGWHLEKRGFELEPFVVVEDLAMPNVTATFPDDHYDLVVIMGAPWSVYEDRIQSWVAPELDLIRRHVDLGTPILGICFGAQAFSAAMGGYVARSARPEYGWHTISSSTPSISEGPWFQFHHDEFTLPPGAIPHAKNGAGVQVFEFGPSLCVQFHPEITADTLASWCAAGGDRDLIEHGVDPEALIEETRRQVPRSQPALETMIDWWLDGMDAGSR